MLAELSVNLGGLGQSRFA